jgi:hypothetical protein
VAEFGLAKREEWRENCVMANGANAVKQAIVHGFGSVEITERHDFNTKDTILDFTSEGQPFAVEVTREFDDDYPKNAVKVDLRRLGETVRGTTNGRVVVMNSGIAVKAA